MGVGVVAAVDVFVGHGLLAFAVVASVAAVYGWTPRRATAIGVVGAAFATLPDIDVVYPLFAITLDLYSVVLGEGAFWEYVSTTHRTVTHSVVIGAIAAVAIALWARRRHSTSSKLLGSALLVSLPIGVGLLDGLLSAVVMGAFVLGGLAVAFVAEFGPFTPRHIAATAVFGLVVHPLGDLFTIPAPELIYPFSLPVEFAYVSLHADPTLHLLSAFFLELGIIWLAVAVHARIHGWSLLPAIRPRAALGVGYAGAIFVLPTPSLAVPTPFVLSVLAVGFLAIPFRPGAELPRVWQVPVTALAAVTAAGLAYTVAYLVVF